MSTQTEAGPTGPLYAVGAADRVLGGFTHRTYYLVPQYLKEVAQVRLNCSWVHRGTHEAAARELIKRDAYDYRRATDYIVSDEPVLYPVRIELRCKVRDLNLNDQPADIIKSFREKRDVRILATFNELVQMSSGQQVAIEADGTIIKLFKCQLTDVYVCYEGDDHGSDSVLDRVPVDASNVPDRGAAHVPSDSAPVLYRIGYTHGGWSEDNRPCRTYYLTPLADLAGLAEAPAVQKISFAGIYWFTDLEPVPVESAHLIIKGHAYGIHLYNVKIAYADGTVITCAHTPARR